MCRTGCPRKLKAKIYTRSRAEHLHLSLRPSPHQAEGEERRPSCGDISVSYPQLQLLYDLPFRDASGSCDVSAPVSHISSSRPPVEFSSLSAPPTHLPPRRGMAVMAAFIQTSPLSPISLPLPEGSSRTIVSPSFLPLSSPLPPYPSRRRCHADQPATATAMMVAAKWAPLGRRSR